MKPNEKQVGGYHYATMKIQPLRYCLDNGLGILEHGAIKYISRHGKKGGREDLEKAIHYIELMIEEYYPMITQGLQDDWSDVEIEVKKPDPGEPEQVAPEQISIPYMEWDPISSDPGDASQYLGCAPSVVETATMEPLFAEHWAEDDYAEKEREAIQADDTPETTPEPVATGYPESWMQYLADNPGTYDRWKRGEYDKSTEEPIFMAWLFSMERDNLEKWGLS